MFYSQGTYLVVFLCCSPLLSVGSPHGSSAFILIIYNKCCQEHLSLSWWKVGKGWVSWYSSNLLLVGEKVLQRSLHLLQICFPAIHNDSFFFENTTAVNWAAMLTDSAIARSSTYFRWIQLISFIFFLQVISSQAIRMAIIIFNHLGWQHIFQSVIYQDMKVSL